VCIAALGIVQIAKYPQIIGALSPTHAVTFLMENPWPGFKVLGSVVLVVTGGEALYADMGHFGRQPIRIAWFAVVLPCLLLNYLGQGAYLLQSGAQHTKDLNLFYALCPEWALYPMVGLATAAAIIASQALISGAYSLTMQAIQLGYVPRLSIAHTSEHERGQIYMPQVNWILMIGCLLLVVGFGSSERLAGVYGVAVTFTMLTTTLLLYYAARRQWGWPAWKASLLCGFLFAIELPFGFANLLKIPHGGWFTLVLAAALYVLMATWKRGRKILWDRVRSMSMSHADFGDYAQRCEYTPVKGIAVFMSGNADGTPLALTHNLKHNRVLHREIIFITVLPAESPRTKPQERVTFEEIPHDLPQHDVSFYRVKARIGFMEQPDVPALLALAAQAGLPYDPKEATFFLSRETIIPSAHPGMALWREWIFSVLSRNAQPATAFFKLPTDQVVELGMQVEI
jgi:KUP system potassium uptake protein